MPYSMTGFGAAEGSVAGGRLRIEIRTVNHRYFNFAPKVPGELAALEADLRERVRRGLPRGHVALSARWTEAPVRAAAARVNLERAREVRDQLETLRRELGLAGEVPLELVARQPDVLQAGSAPPEELPFSALEPIVDAAVAECRTMRRREGAVLAEELRQRLAAIEQRAAEVAALAPQRLVRERDRLRLAVAALLEGRALPEERLAQELAVLADKLDIREELVRLAAHLAACRAALEGDDAVGKQLGFLAQELGREVNTIGSKANDAAIAHHVVAMKGELEQIKEQLENLE